MDSTTQPASPAPRSDATGGDGQPLAGRRALVTDAASGIGAACARALSAAARR